MKHYLAILLFVFIGFTGVAQTKDDANSESKMEERIQKMKTELALTTDQESKLRTAMTQQLEDMKAQKKIVRKAEKEMREVNKQYHETLSTFLSEDQMEKMKGMKPNAEDRADREKAKEEKVGKGQKK